eukprot:2888886-Rhodomonas_salina.1
MDDWGGETRETICREHSRGVSLDALGCQEHRLHTQRAGRLRDHGQSAAGQDNTGGSNQGHATSKKLLLPHCNGCGKEQQRHIQTIQDGSSVQGGNARRHSEDGIVNNIGDWSRRRKPTPEVTVRIGRRVGEMWLESSEEIAGFVPDGVVTITEKGGSKRKSKILILE